MDNLAEMTFNAMFYVFCVALAGGLGLVTAFMIGFKLYRRMTTEKERRGQKKGVKQRTA